MRILSVRSDKKTVFNYVQRQSLKHFRASKHVLSTELPDHLKDVNAISKYFDEISNVSLVTEKRFLKHSW